MGHQPLLHLLGRAADVRIAHEPLGHRLEARGHVLHRSLLGDLQKDRLAGGGDHCLRLGPHHVDALAAQALALETTVAQLRAQTIQGEMQLRHVHRPRHDLPQDYDDGLCLPEYMASISDA